MLNGIALHKQGFTGKGVKVAVLDAGFFHVNKMRCFDQNLFENGHLLGCRDFVTGDTLVFEDDTHGLMVLSCMAANLTGKMVGTAPDAQYWLIRTEDADSEFPIEECNWASGAESADSAGVDVINTSWIHRFRFGRNESHL
jgi:subtilisin family serine protease